MRRLISSLAALGLVLVLGLANGCVISEFPLSDPAPSEADKLLYGRWRAPDGNAYTIMEFAPPTDATPKARWKRHEQLMVLTVARYEKDQQLPAHATTERAFVTQIGDTTFLNIYDESERGYRILRYRIDGDTLDTWVLDSTATADAIRKGDLLAGDVTHDRGEVHRVRIRRPVKEAAPHESRDKLRSLVTGKSAETVFPDSCKQSYTRVKNRK